MSMNWPNFMMVLCAAVAAMAAWWARGRWDRAGHVIDGSDDAWADELATWPGVQPHDPSCQQVAAPPAWTAPEAERLADPDLQAYVSDITRRTDLFIARLPGIPPAVALRRASL